VDFFSATSRKPFFPLGGSYLFKKKLTPSPFSKLTKSVLGGFLVHDSEPSEIWFLLLYPLTSSLLNEIPPLEGYPSPLPPNTSLPGIGGPETPLSLPTVDTQAYGLPPPLRLITVLCYVLNQTQRITFFFFFLSS